MGSCFDKPQNPKKFTDLRNQCDNHRNHINDESLTTNLSDVNSSNLMHLPHHQNFHSSHHQQQQHHSNIATNINNTNNNNNNNNNSNQNTSNRKDLYAALYDYDARGHQDLSFKTGDHLIIKSPE
jgi:hypothetical protein